jgi:predicted RNA binding protein YcfA (HicA-like mRNA interferase family)
LSESRQRLSPVRYRVLVRLFEADGFAVVRTRGDHIIMTKRGVKRPVVIKSSPRMVPIAHVVTNMRTAEMTRERFFELLDEVS